MFLKWTGCPRISFIPLAFGVIFGFHFGQWWFLQPSLQFNDPKITCLILQRSSSFENVNVSKETWLKKCHNYIIVKPIQLRRVLNWPPKVKEDCDVPMDVLTVAADSAWGVLCRTFYLLPPLEWLIIVPDSSFVIVENLKYYVRGIDWRRPRYLGHAVEHFSSDYNVLSAGIVLSNGSVNRLLSEFRDDVACDASGKYWNNEDMHLGSYLKKLGVEIEDTRDPNGGGRFHGYNPNTLLFPGQIFKKTNYFKKAVYSIKEGSKCCSPYLITIDTSDADHALLAYFLLYGIKLHNNYETSKPPVIMHEESWVKSLRDIGYNGPTANITAQQYYDIWAKHIPPERLSQKFAEAVAP